MMNQLRAFFIYLQIIKPSFLPIILRGGMLRYCDIVYGKSLIINTISQYPNIPISQYPNIRSISPYFSEAPILYPPQ